MGKDLELRIFLLLRPDSILRLFFECKSDEDESENTKTQGEEGRGRVDVQVVDRAEHDALRSQGGQGQLESWRRRMDREGKRRLPGPRTAPMPIPNSTIETAFDRSFGRATVTA